MTAATLDVSPTPVPRSLPIFLCATALCVTGWAYWPNLAEMAHAWSHNPQYSHGYLVPGFAALLLWLRRDKLDATALAPSWWGAPFLLLGVGLRLYGSRFHFQYIDSISLLPTLAGLCLMFGGWAAWRWAWPAILFLFFMVPLPYRAATTLSAPLQRIATICSTFVLQVLGLPAVAEGNVIHINDAPPLGIVEACNGLRMLVVFFALSTGMVMLIKKPLGDKLFLVASSVPIALAVNILRITITGILYDKVDSETAELFFHDFAGWLMPPMALGMLWIEMKILSLLLVESQHIPVRASTRGRGPASAQAAQRRTPRPTAKQQEAVVVRAAAKAPDDNLVPVARTDR